MDIVSGNVIADFTLEVISLHEPRAIQIYLLKQVGIKITPLFVNHKDYNHMTFSSDLICHKILQVRG